MRITDKREQRLMTATPEALETERSSIQRFADKMEIDRGIGLLDAGGVQLERDLIDWRVETFNRALERRPDLKLDRIDSSTVYDEAAAKALDRREAVAESYRQQSPAPAEQRHLKARYDLPPELKQELDATRDRDIQLEQLADLVAGQENNIREEWLADLQTGRLDRHALDSYFAGRVDQHNTLIGMAVEAHPHLRETLPPPIQYGQMRDDLQQQITQAQQQIERNSQAAEQQFRFAL